MKSEKKFDGIGHGPRYMQSMQGDYLSVGVTAGESDIETDCEHG